MICSRVVSNGLRPSAFDCNKTQEMIMISVNQVMPMEEAVQQVSATTLKTFEGIDVAFVVH